VLNSNQLLLFKILNIIILLSTIKLSMLITNQLTDVGGGGGGWAGMT
jgi:hypothetical protein